MPASTGTEVHAREGREQARDRWLIGSVITAATLVVAASVGLAVSLTGRGSPGPVPSTFAAPGQASGPTTRDGGAGSAGGRGATSTPSSGSTTTPQSSVPPTPGGAPVISGLVPSSGPAGQGIQVAGANFLSSSGRIVATFNGRVATTSCPAQNTCTVTVPSLPGSSSAQVVITTSAGTSNPVTFTYN